MATASMLSVEDALERILTYFHVLEPEDRALLDCLGQVLAEDVRSDIDIPPLPNSSMDGYAVQWASIAGATSETPRLLRVLGEVAAGSLPHQEVVPGGAIRIMTGAPIPQGTDTVVPFEDTDEVERRRRGVGKLTEIAILKELRRGANVRPAALDVAKGQMVLSKGTVLRASEIGVLASLGKARVKVIRRPVIAVLATGDELVEPGQVLSPGKIYDINTYSIAASVLRYGGIPRVLGIAQDNLESLEAKVEEGLDSDLLITTAGVSKGDYDIVKDVLAHRGQIDFWSVRMRPAKPLAFGVLFQRDKGGRVLKHVPHLGLPGNPVSSMVAFEQFGRPAILKMMGKEDFAKPTLEAILEEPIINDDGRRVYARAIVSKRNGVYYARLTGHQGSNILTSMAKANALAICPEDVPMMKAGERVKVQMLDWAEDQS